MGAWADKPAVALIGGVVLGALLLLVLPSSWLFREPPVARSAMGDAGTPEGTYIGMVRHNIDTIAAALRGEDSHEH